MSQKKLEPGSEYEKYDLDGDGIVTDEEFEMDQKLVRLENEDKKEDAQRHMAWFALFGMLLYPALVVASVFTGALATFGLSTGNGKKDKETKPKT